ncbi:MULTISPECIES: hypothetical protein [Streptomyces]
MTRTLGSTNALSSEYAPVKLGARVRHPSYRGRVPAMFSAR